MGLDCVWLRSVCRSATGWRTERGHFLMREDPTRGLPIPRNKNPKRPMATWDRYEALRDVADQVIVQTGWEDGEPVYERSHFGELLGLAVATGRRITPIVALRYSDLRLKRTKTAPHGPVVWPAHTDKTDREQLVPRL